MSRPPLSAAVPASLRELERHMARLRYAMGGQTHYDMWEHYGAGSASSETRAEMEADLATCNRIYGESQAALESMVATLRAEAPEVITAWTGAHDAYLAGVVDDLVAAGDDYEAVAVQRERVAWANVLAGASAFVVERVNYALERDARYRELFGFARDRGT